MKASASHFFDPAVTQAKIVASQVTQLSEESLLANGAEKFATWEITMDANAVLKSLERIVREESLGKVFGDGQIFAQIPDARVATISFFKLEDGSGVSIADIVGGEQAMKTLLGKVDMSDLDINPKPPVRKQPKAAAPQQAQLTLGDGQQINVALAPPPQAPFNPGRRIPMEALGGNVPVPGHNPVAMKAFLNDALTASRQAIPMDDASNLAIASMMAATSEAHPEDDAWPEGITVKNGATGEPIASPKAAIAAFEAALEGREGPVIQREDLASQFEKFRAGKAQATDVQTIEMDKPRAPGM